MPEKATLQKAKEDLHEGKAASTAAGEFVKEEMDHIRGGKHGARSTKQAIAIGLSKARRAGVPLKPPKKGTASAATRRKAEREYATGQGRRKTKSGSARRSRARQEALKREPRSAASRRNLSKQAKTAAQKRGSSARRQAAAKAARTKQKKAA